MESPIESLLSDHLTFGISAAVSNLWSWLALLTAAVSFWTIRTSTTVNVISTSNSIDESIPHQSDLPPEPEIQSKREISPPKAAAPWPVILEDDAGVTKGKFVVYYEDDGERDSEVESESEKEPPVAGEWECGGGSGVWRESYGFERLLKMRMEDFRWYRYQDLTAINGNVVRLWDGVQI